MNITVLIKFVPDLVEDLEIDGETGLLDRGFLRQIPNELDEHALEEALLLKERRGGTVAAITVDVGDVDETLYTAIAKGADRVVKITAEGVVPGVGSQKLAGVFQRVLADTSWDLILTGTQAVDDLDGFVGALLADRMGLPYVGYVTKVETTNGKVIARKEYPGGLSADIEVSMPAVLGIQAAEKPPRYVVTSKVMEAMRSGRIEEADAGELPAEGEIVISNMLIPESASHAEMIRGSEQQVAEALAELLRERGLIA